MNNSSKGILIFFFIYAFFLFVLPISISLFSGDSENGNGIFDYARITDMDYKAVVMDEVSNGGNVLITETITFDVHAASKNNPFYELWRDLPEDTVDGLDIKYDVLSVKQVDENGNKIEWEESSKLYWSDSDYTSTTYGPGKWYHSKGPFNDYNRFECIFFYVDGIYREKITFEIQYVMYNAALKYSDVSELYLSMFSGESVHHLESFDAEILIPYKDMPKEGNYTAHTFGTSNHTFDFTESKTKNPGYHTFSFSLDKDDLKFDNYYGDDWETEDDGTTLSKYNEYIEFTLLSYNEDKHIFTDYAPRNHYSHDVYLEEAMEYLEDYDKVPARYRNIKIILFIGVIVITFIFVRKAINKKKYIEERYILHKPHQEIEYFRDIPSDLDPYFAANLALCKEKKKVPDEGDGYSAVLLSLVSKGYIKLSKMESNLDWSNRNIMIEIMYRPELDSNAVTVEEVTPNHIMSNYAPQQVDTGMGLNDIVSRNLDINNNNLVQNEVVTPPVVPFNPFNTVTTDIKRYDINGKELEELTGNEKIYFNLIVRHSYDGRINMALLQQKVSHDYDKTDEFVTAFENSVVNIGISEDYLQKSDFLEIKKHLKGSGTRYIVFAILIVIFGNLIISTTRLDLLFGGLFIMSAALFVIGLYYKKIAPNYALLTQFGEDEYQKWHGLYNFLNSETLMNEKNVLDVKLWEKYLVYATAFGISEKVSKALEVNYPDMADSIVLNNTYYRSSTFRSSSRSFRSSARSASSYSRSSRSSSYGGYGGGGRGGGGGGGGH